MSRTRRTSIEVPGLGHGGQPFPLASRVGPLLLTSAIHGTDPSTGEMGATADIQIRQAFDNLGAVLAAAGGSLDDVGQVLVTLADRSDRVLVNEVWTALFPDPTSRPARNTTERPLGGGALVALMATAWIDDNPH
ncbi:MAG: RidA family protein [Acidimicrobiia bacterium]